MAIKINNSVEFDSFGTKVCIDGSYVIYHSLFSAVKTWCEESPYSSVVTDADVTDEDFERVDITKYDDFMDIYRGKFIEALTRIQTMVKDFNTMESSTTIGQMLFVLDPEHGVESRSWRYLIYPEYKGRRADARDKKPYDVIKVFVKGVEMLRANDLFAKRFNVKFVSADRAEADDIIATVMMDECNKNCKKFLVASDHDYLQLKDVVQMNLEGKVIEIEQPYPDLITMTPETYLLAKIITGDTSDNITQVFNRVGYKTAVKKYIANTEFLNESLENDEVALSKFKRNTRLIDFGKIPEKIKAIARKAIAE